MILKLEAFFIAIYLFFAGIVYGDEPVKLEFSYDIPSDVYIYEPGDKFELDITVKNVGRPFKGGLPMNNSTGIEIYQELGEEKYTLFRPWKETYIAADTLVKKDYTETINTSFFLPKETPEGYYSVDIAYNGVIFTFENVFEVK